MASNVKDSTPRGIGRRRLIDGPIGRVAALCATVLVGAVTRSAVGTEWVWQAMTSPTSEHLYGVWGSGANDVFVAGPNATILHYDGSAWSSMSSPTAEDLRSACGSGPNDVIAVGYAGTILHYDGATWSVMSSGATADLYAAWSSGPNDVFVVGDAGTILHYDGSAWSSMSCPTTEDLRNVHGSGPNDVFGVGRDGVIVHYDGAAWSEMTSGTTDHVYGVWAAGPNDVFAAGISGLILHGDGATWSAMTSGTTASLFALWGTSGTDVFAVGSAGTILHYDGASWSTMTSATTNALADVWGSAGNDVFAVGYSGTVVHYGATTVHNVTQDTYHTTIQDAIDDANDADEIVLAPVTFTGEGNRDLDYGGKAITVTSEDPNDPNVVAATVIDCQSSGRGFYFHSGEGPNAVVAGLSIMGGYAHDGGGIYCDGSSPTVIDCTFVSNTAARRGGAMWNGNGANASLANCTFAANQTSGDPNTSEGGAMYNTGSSATLIDCTFEDNHTDDTAADVAGGAIYNIYGSDSVLIGCVFRGNSTSLSGAPAKGLGGAVLLGNSTPYLMSCVFGGNVGTMGGGVAISGSDPNYGSTQSPQLVNCTFSGNHATAAPPYGGGGLHVRGWPSAPIVTNCIFWGNTASGVSQEIAQIDDHVFGGTYTFNCIEGLVPGGDFDSGGNTDNIDDDPLFEDPNGPDGDPNTWDDNDYHLSSGSPCIDTGDPNGDYAGQMDIDGQRREMGSQVDMGADEYFYPILTLTIIGQDKGEVICEPNLAYYEPNATVTLTADWYDGKAFVGWGGDIPEGHEHDNPLVITMDSDKEIIATFKCGFGLGPLLPMIALGMLGLGLLRRRR